MSIEEINETKKQIDKALNLMKGKDINNVFFVSCGGSFALMYLSKYIVDCEASKIDAHIYSSNEFLHRKHGKLNSKSVVLFCSHSGNTPESVEASKYAKEMGALTISLTNSLDGKLAEICDIPLKYEWGKNPFASSHSMLYQITFGLLDIVEGIDRLNEVTTDLKRLEHLFVVNTERFERKAIEFGNNHKKEDVIYSLASGINYGVAYGFSICSMMEQQWIHSNSIHAGEYFHGPFEIIDKNVPIVILLGLDRTRPMEERALEFTRKYSNKVTVVDAKEFKLGDIKESNKGYIAALILNHLVRYYAEKLSVKRDHPLSTRRYMGIVDY